MRKILTAVLGALVLFISPQLSQAQTTQVDALIKKLVEKKILTKQEARELKSEIAADEKAIREETKNSILPEWVARMKVKGDLRLRHQYERKKNDTEARNRSRIRYRLGLIVNPVKHVEVGAGLASGSNSDPRSTNQTLENSFEHPDIRLDYAYVQWQAREDLKVVGGKFLRKDYLWSPTDMLWDSDINPNGASFSYDPKFTESLKGLFKAGYWVIEENGKVDTADPFLKYVQGGLAYTKGKVDATAAATAYGFNGLTGTCTEWSAKTNTGMTGATINSSTGACTAGTGSLTYDYDAFGASTEIGAKKLFGGLPFSIDGRMALFGDFIHNPDTDIKNNGWAYGAVFGSEALKTPGDWQMRFTKVILERDAWLDFLPDSDRLAGATNILSHEAEWQFVWKENISFGVDYYYSDTYSGSSNPEQLVQADMVLKF